MRKFLAILFVLFITLGLVLHDAQAGRFGGGRSFGMQRSIGNYSRGFNAAPATGLGAQQSLRQNSQNSMGRWLGPLTGLAAGGLLAYLLMGHGIGNGILSWILMAGALFFIINFIRQRMAPAMQTATQNQQNYRSAFTQQATNIHSLYPQQSSINIDQDGFLRDAKVQFIRLQAAYDNKDLNDLRTFTTPQVFGEIQVQLQERQNAVNKTEVVTLAAQLLDVDQEFQIPVASVRFSGLIREEDQAPANFAEIWHFRQNAPDQWVVAGIQQE